MKLSLSQVRRVNDSMLAAHQILLDHNNCVTRSNVDLTRRFKNIKFGFLSGLGFALFGSTLLPVIVLPLAGIVSSVVACGPEVPEHVQKIRKEHSIDIYQRIETMDFPKLKLTPVELDKLTDEELKTVCINAYIKKDLAEPNH